MSEIKSKVITPEYAENYDRIYGENKPEPTSRRMRLVYRPGHAEANERGFVEAWKVHDEPESRVQISVDRHYENLNLVDGTVINSRRQHREYMNARGLTLADDFKETWKKNVEQREKFRAGDFDHKERREALGRAAYKKGLI